MNQKNDKDKSVSIRMPLKLLKELRYVADYEGRSLNGQVLYLIRNCIRVFKKKYGDFDIDEK